MVFISVIFTFVLDVLYRMTWGFWLEDSNVFSIWKIIESIFLIYAGTLSPDFMGINRHMWYLCVLIVCYIIFWLLNRVAKNMKIPIVYLYSFLVLVGIIILLYDISLPFASHNVARGYICFFSGAFACERIYKKNSIISCRSKFVLWVIVLLFVILSLNERSYHFLFGNQNTIILGLIFFPALVMLFLYSKLFNYLFNNSICNFLGMISFDIYVFHKPFIVLLLICFKENLDFAGNGYFMYVFGLFMIVLGAALHILIERPINIRIKKHIN